MIPNDPLLQLQVKSAAQEYVLKFVLQALHQILPHSNLQSAMHEMLQNSIASMTIEGNASASPEELRQAVRAHAAQIIDAGIGAVPAQR